MLTQARLVRSFWRGLIALGLLAGLVAVIRMGSRHFLFPAPAWSTQHAPDGFARRTLLAKDGVSVHVLERIVGESSKTVVCFHNNRETAEQGAAMARSLNARGYAVVLVEYRGYGASHGEQPTEQGLYLDAEAVLDMLAARGIGPERVVLWGVSLGTGVAAEMAARGRGAQLVLVAPYTSIPDLVAAAVPFLPAHLLLADHFETLKKAERIRIPTLVVHGDADEIVPFWMGKYLSHAIRGARLIRVRGGHHGDLFAREREHLLQEFVNFAGLSR